MKTQHTPLDNDILRYGTNASRQCRGVNASGHAGLVYLLGCYRTWLGAEMLLNTTNTGIGVLRAVRDICDRSATPLMATLRTYATQRLVEPQSSASTADDIDAPIEILPQDDWLSGADIARTDAGLTQEQVMGELDAFA